MTKRRTPEGEDQAAAYYESHRDDADVWGEPVESPPAERRAGLSATITVRFSPEEAGHIRRVAADRGLTYSSVVREAARCYSQRVVQLVVSINAKQAASLASEKPLRGHHFAGID